VDNELVTTGNLAAILLGMSKIENEYYRNYYSSIQRQKLQGLGSRLTDISLMKTLAKLLRNLNDPLILELGASSGEFTEIALKTLPYKKYFALDLNPGLANPELYATVKRNNPDIEFITGNAEKLPYEENSFDICFSTCLLAHVNDPEKVMSEALRVTKKGGFVVFLLPTDPGFANQLVKKLITYPSMRKSGIQHPEYIYSQEHKNPIHNIIAISRHVYEPYFKRFAYRPFFVPGWNINLWLKIVVKK